MLLTLFTLGGGGGFIPPEPPPVVEEQPSGGSFYFRQEQERLHREADEERERQELIEEADRLERHLIENGTLTGPDPEIERIRSLADEYIPSAPNRAKRAIEYAQRVRTLQAWQLAMREIEKMQQEEELAVLLLLTLD